MSQESDIINNDSESETDLDFLATEIAEQVIETERIIAEATEAVFSIEIERPNSTSSQE